MRDAAAEAETSRLAAALTEGGAAERAAAKLAAAVKFAEIGGNRPASEGIPRSELAVELSGSEQKQTM